MLRQIVLLALVAAASAHFYKPSCPMVPGKYPFDLDKFQGDWYLAAGNDLSLELKGKCGKVTFPTLMKEKEGKDAVLSSRYTGVSIKDNTPIAYDFTMQPIISDKIANLYSVFRAEGSNTYSAIYKTSIVATDYNTYALYLACKPVFNAETKTYGRTLFSEIWTRKDVTLSKDTMDTLTNILSSYDIDATSIKTIERNC
ncbi:bilin-binding protein-like [Thrips palmi]|uniref:Bilin-binding protein-like n=1 Tax=Thrips palmi TaxID=161013 RepID=A0A6P8Z7X4_THRPL|nr:bilin-binding protein-like [Thrips palmi]